jgi:hypothetical protein
MEIEYQLTEADIITLTRYRLRQAPARRNPVLLRQVAYSAGFTLLAIGSWVQLSNAVLSFAFLALAVLSFFAYPSYFEWALRRRVMTVYSDEKMRATLAPRILRVSSDGINEESALGHISIKWDAVDNIGIVPDFTVLSIQNVPSMIIPEKGIIAGDYKSFVQACRQFSQKDVV